MNNNNVIQDIDIQGIVSIRIVEKVGSSGVYYEVLMQIMSLGSKPTIVQKATLDEAMQYATTLHNNLSRLYQQIDDIVEKDTYNKMSMFGTPPAHGKVYQGLGSTNQIEEDKRV